MRKIGQIKNRNQLKKFCDYLYYHGIESHFYDGGEDVWVLKDDEREKAKELFVFFEKSQESSSSKNLLEVEEKSALGAQKLLAQKKEIFAKEKKAKIIDFRTNQRRSIGFTLVSGTGFIILVCVLVFILLQTEAKESIYRFLFISQIVQPNLYGIPAFYEVGLGEVWRLVTPIFLHHDFFHILFNMMWVYQIGTLIEKKEGTIFYLGLIAFVGVASNCAFYLVAGPNFGGMSGVVYGFVAYLWAYSKASPMSSYHFDHGLIRFFVFWYVLCWFLTAFSLFGFRVANTVHGVGALAGCFLGILRAYRKEENVLPVKRLFSKDNLSQFGIFLVLVFASFYVDSF